VEKTQIQNSCRPEKPRSPGQSNNATDLLGKSLTSIMHSKEMEGTSMEK
jgi:hypothetical protein